MNKSKQENINDEKYLKKENISKDKTKFKDDTINNKLSKEKVSLNKNDIFYPNFLFAGFGIRALALIIDFLVIYSISKIILNPAESILGIKDTGLFFSLYNLTYITIYLGYFTLITKFTNGQTLGKIIMGLRVVSLHEKTLSWKTVFVREFLGRFILKRLKFLYIPAIFSMKKQQIADILANTSVVREGYLLEYKEIKKLHSELS